MNNKVCMVSGVGEGNGRSIGSRFASEGYRVAMLARTREKLDHFEREIDGAKGFVCDVTDADSMLSTVAPVRDELGPIDVFAHNGGSGVFGDFMSVNAEQTMDAWRTHTMGLFVLGQAVVEGMLKSGRGSIIVEGVTSALRGGANFAAFASASRRDRRCDLVIE